MRNKRVTLLILTAMLVVAVGAAGQKEKKGVIPAAQRAEQIPADEALTGVPLDMTPNQLPDQFRTQLRDDVKKSRGVAILKQKGNDVEYTFAWENMTSPVISGHFHYGPHGAVSQRAYSICGVANESPACPTGTRNSISGVWKNADIDAFKKGDVIIAFHTEKYPAPIGEIAAYIPADQGK
jgi:hypothetical protein